MGRFHIHADGTTHTHAAGEHAHDPASDHDAPADREHDHSGAVVGDHSGFATGALRVDVLQRILGENERTADANRADFDRHAITVVNLMSSPGAGKTTLLRETLIRLADAASTPSASRPGPTQSAPHVRTPVAWRSPRVGIVEGDIETSLDADRLDGLGAAISLVNTANGFGGECHLDAAMVRSALTRLPLPDLDLLLIENVGNLVCPAEFDVGEHARAMVFSVTEGEEKPRKYPVMFRSADVILVNKIDLLPYLRFDLDAFYAHLHDVHPCVRTIEISATNGDGIDEWIDWLLTVAPATATR